MMALKADTTNNVIFKGHFNNDFTYIDIGN